MRKPLTASRAHRCLMALPVLSLLTLFIGVPAVSHLPPAGAQSGQPGASAIPRPSAGIIEAYHNPPGLVLRGERVTIWYYADTGSGRWQGTAYVRGAPTGPYTQLRFSGSIDGGSPPVVVPARMLTGSVLEDYVVLRDPAGGQPVTIPPAGPRAPYRSWIVDHPATIALGTHTFGNLRAPGAIVARAAAGDDPGEVGFNLPKQGESTGPSSFAVARDSTIWVADQVNDRLLVYAPGAPDSPARTITMPAGPLEVAIAPRGTVFVMTGAPHYPPNPRMVYAFSPDGRQLWAVPAAGQIFNPVMIADSDGVPWIHDETGWIPVTDRAGHPFAVAQQQRQTVAYQRIGGGLELVDTAVWPHSDWIGLATTAGSLLRTWKITSSSDFQPMWQAMIGPDLVDIGSVQKQAGGHVATEFLAVRISKDAQVLDQVSMDAHLSFNWGEFTPVRVGPDGRLYHLQTSPDWGMRVARYTLRGAPAERTSPTPAPSQASTPPSASPAPSTPHESTLPAAVTNPTRPASSAGGLTPPAVGWHLAGNRGSGRTGRNHSCHVVAQAQNQPTLAMPPRNASQLPAHQGNRRAVPLEALTPRMG